MVASRRARGFDTADLGHVSREFFLHNSVLLGTMALLVAVVGAGRLGGDEFLRRFATARWALLLPVPICAVVASISVLPDAADALTWLALLAVPPGAALALGWAVRGARPALAVLAAPLLALAWASQGTAQGDLAALALTALSCVTLGRLLAGVTPLGWLKLGLVALAISDAILVFGNSLDDPNAVLNAAVPAPGLPRLQHAHFGPANLGYGDFFATGVLGGILAAERGPQWWAAALTFALCEAWTLLFYVTDLLPATVPVAVALIIVEVRRRKSSWGPASAGHMPRAGTPRQTPPRWSSRSARSGRAGVAMDVGPTSSSPRAGP